jgi:hypothetical protein
LTFIVLKMEPPFIEALLCEDHPAEVDVKPPPHPSDEPLWYSQAEYQKVPPSQPVLEMAMRLQSSRGGGQFFLFDYDEAEVVA